MKTLKRPSYFEVEDRDTKKYYLDRNENLDPHLKKVILRYSKEIIKSATFLTYPDAKYYCNKLASFYGIQNNNLLFTNGCDGAIKMFFDFVVKQKSMILNFTPTYYIIDFYKEYKQCFQEIHPVPDTFSRLQEILQNSHAKFLYFCHPNQPTGHFYSLQQLQEILEICEKKNIVVFIDEAYADFINFSAVSLINKFHNLYIGKSFSKAWGLAGLRIGCILSCSQNIDYLNQYRAVAPVSSLALHVLSKMVDNYSEVQKSTQRILDGRQLLIKEIFKNKGVIHNIPSLSFLHFSAPQQLISHIQQKCAIKQNTDGTYCMAAQPVEIIKDILYA